MARDRVVVGLDVGTTKVCTLIAEVKGGGQVQVVGVGVCPSRGVRKGVVVDMDEATASISASLKKAEVFSGYRIIGAHLAVSGGHVDSEPMRAAIPLSLDRPVSQEDMSEVLEAARPSDVSEGRQVLHVIPRGFVVDGEGGIQNPVGMLGSRLEVEGLVVMSASAPLQNVRRCVERAGIQIDSLVSAGLASARAVLTDPEKQLGVLLMDIGGGTTDLVWFRDGEAHYVAALPVGGNHVTNDIAVGLGVPFTTAEELKLRLATAVPSAVDEDEMVDAGPVSGGETRRVSRRFMAEIVEARVSEVFSLALAELMQSGFDDILPAGAVLTGGAAQLRGIRELAQRTLKIPVRVGLPEGLSGAVDSICAPAYATGAGLLKGAAASAGEVEGTARSARRRVGLGTRLMGVAKAFLP